MIGHDASQLKARSRRPTRLAANEVRLHATPVAEADQSEPDNRMTK